MIRATTKKIVYIVPNSTLAMPTLDKPLTAQDWAWATFVVAATLYFSLRIWFVL